MSYDVRNDPKLVELREDQSSILPEGLSRRAFELGFDQGVLAAAKLVRDSQDK